MPAVPDLPTLRSANCIILTPASDEDRISPPEAAGITLCSQPDGRENSLEFNRSAEDVNPLLTLLRLIPAIHLKPSISPGIAQLGLILIASTSRKGTGEHQAGGKSSCNLLRLGIPTNAIERRPRGRTSCGISGAFWSRSSLAFLPLILT